jgi:4-hydroxy-tetrahydrodipicolinate synthase
MDLANKMVPKISGVYAAMPTPFGDDGLPDFEALDPAVDFLIAAGVSGLCIGGATGEYPACSVVERELIFRRVAARSKNSLPLMFGVGAGNAAQVKHLAQVALECGGNAVLLPPPYYYRYKSEEVVEFIHNLAKDLGLPVLIYYIPRFTNEFDPRDVLRLIETTPNVVGIKDSSGLRENVALLGEAKSRMRMLYFSGDDSLLIDAFRHGADGAISGVASAFPELVMAAEEVRRNEGGNYPAWIQRLLDEFISQIDALPTPWGVKLAAEARGLRMGPLSWSGGDQMASRIEDFRCWFGTWLPSSLKTIGSR